MPKASRRTCSNARALAKTSTLFEHNSAGYILMHVYIVYGNINTIRLYRLSLCHPVSLVAAATHPTKGYVLLLLRANSKHPKPAGKSMCPKCRPPSRQKKKKIRKECAYNTQYVDGILFTDNTTRLPLASYESSECAHIIVMHIGGTINW